MRIVFMGTPEFAVPSLEALLASEDQVVGVVTQPDRPKGRGHELAPPPVKLVAQRAGIPFLQPLKIRTPDFLEALAAWKPDLIAVTGDAVDHGLRGRAVIVTAARLGRLDQDAGIENAHGQRTLAHGKPLRNGFDACGKIRGLCNSQQKAKN